MSTSVFVTVGSAIFGLAIGSFLNVVMHRVPRGESIVRPRSRCPQCRTQLTERDNVPVVSWVLLRGRCRTCRASIPVRYPLVELGTAVAFAAAGARLDAELLVPGLLVLSALVVVTVALPLRVWSRA
jgi:leader peptidase (prepilin peptidase)/N-methyltransferase